MPMENLGLGGMQEALSEPGQRVSLFNYSDPIVHNRVFGLARFDLNTRKFDFTPIGPSPAAMGGLFVTPDKKMGYTMSSNGARRQPALRILGHRSHHHQARPHRRSAVPVALQLRHFDQRQEALHLRRGLSRLKSTTP